MKRIILLASFTATLCFATSFTLTNNQSGESYTCGAGGGGQADPNCVSDINHVCDFETSFSDNECFLKSSNACRGGATATCVKDVNQECDFETSLSDNECFDEAVRACGGDVRGIQNLIRAAKSATEEKMRKEISDRREKK